MVVTERAVLQLEAEFDKNVAALKPFDLGAWIGYPTGGWAVYPEPEDLSAALAEQGIRGALVSHKASELLDAVYGNELLAQTLPRMPGCHGALMLLPPGGGEIPDLGRYIDENVDRGFRAVRIAPKSHRYTLRIPSVPVLLAEIQKRNLPLFIPIGQTSWDEIAGIAKAYPKLAIVVEGVGHHEYLNIRTCLSWLESVSNLLVVTTSLFLCGGLEMLVDRVGAQRVLFASNQPIDDPAAGLSLLVYSELPLETRRQIASENAERLMATAGKGGYFA